MKTQLVLVVLILLTTTLLCSCTGRHDESKREGSSTDTSTPAPAAEEFYYTCPMHPSVRADKPGACPVCGMALVRKTIGRKPQPEQESAPEKVSLTGTQRVMADISTTEVGKSDLGREVSCVGVVDVAEPLQAKVSARFSGRIEKLYVDFTGAVVKRGQPLFELYSPDLAAAEKELLVLLGSPDDSSGIGPDREGLLAAARDRLEMRFGMTREQIDQITSSREVKTTLTIHSPISGTVITKAIQSGDYVNEGMLLYQLADLTSIWVYLDVYEQDVRYMRLGQAVAITTDSYPNEVFRGRVTFIDAVLNAATRTVRVRSEFLNPGGRLKPQMFVKARIEVPSHNAIVIPATAVISTGQRNVVWVETETNVFEPRGVKLGSSASGMVEVVSGLRQGEHVVTTGGFLLDSESQLQHPAASHDHH